MTKNATVTVTYGGKSATFELDGTELSGPHTDNGGHRYLNTASRDYVATEVERVLLDLTEADDEPLRPAGEGGWGLY
jgi:hypothetical protein